MSIDLGRRLIAAGLVSPEEVEAALFFSVARGVPFARVLIDRGAITERGLEEELERVGGLGLRQVAGAAELVARLPRALCRRLAALPTRVDPATGAVDVAAADPLDPHIAAEFGFHLGAAVRVLRAPIAAVEEAIRRLELDEPEEHTRARPRRVTPAFPHGAPQSTIPPPVVDEAPIPLVRKVASDGARPEATRAGGTLVPPSGVPGDAPTPALPVAARPIVAPGYEGPRAPVTRPIVRDGTSGAQPPAVSFPSAPPQRGERATPPYGTPLSELGIHPAIAESDLGYRIAPPAHEDPLRPGSDPPPPPNHAPSRPPPTLPTPVGPVPSAPSTLSPVRTVLGPSPQPGPRLEESRYTGAPRRPARPALGDVPYPAAVRPQPAGVVRTSLSDEEEAPPPPPEPPKRARMPDFTPLMDLLAQASGRDDVIRVAMRGMRLVARRLAVFAVKRDGFHGWSCNADFGDSEVLRELVIPADQPSVLATAAATAVYLGPIPATPAHEGLLQVMERASSDVAAVAVRVAGRPALVMICDDLEDTMIGTRFLGDLARAIGEALVCLIAR